MADPFTILIADRNPHVREFLRRELIAEGYQVQIAKNGREVLRMTDVDDPPELLILDLDMPYVNGLAILEEIENRKSAMPVMIHTFCMEYEKHPAVQRAAGFLEKCGNNIDGFKATISQVLRKCYPHRFLSRVGAEKQRTEPSLDTK